MIENRSQGRTNSKPIRQCAPRSASQYAASCSSSCIISTHTTRNLVWSAISAGSIATTNDALDTRWALCMSMTPPLAPIKPPPFCIWCSSSTCKTCVVPAPNPHHFSYWAPGDWVGYNVTDSAFKIELQFLHNDWTQCLILGFKQGTKNQEIGIFIGPESDYIAWSCQWLTHSVLLRLNWETLAVEDVNAKLDIVATAEVGTEEIVDNDRMSTSAVAAWQEQLFAVCICLVKT